MSVGRVTQGLQITNQETANWIQNTGFRWRQERKRLYARD